MPKFAIDSSILNNLTHIIEEEKSKIKSNIKEIKNALEVYNRPEAGKLYDELFKEIKSFVTMDKELQDGFDLTRIDEIENKLEKMLKSFKKIVPKMPLYFSKNLGKDIVIMELILESEENKVTKHRLLTGKVVYKNLNIVIQDYNSFFKIVDNACDLETNLAKYYLSAGKKAKAKESLGKKKLYSHNSQRLLWQWLNFERITVISVLIPVIRIIKESKKEKRISIMNIKIIKALTTRITAERVKVDSLVKKYSKYSETVYFLNNYSDTYTKIADILYKIV